MMGAAQAAPGAAGKRPVALIPDFSNSKPIPGAPNLSPDGLTRGVERDAKLSPDLSTLCDQFSGRKSRAKNPRRFSDQQLHDRFGIAAGDASPRVTVAVTLKPGATADEIKSAGIASSLAAGGDMVVCIEPVAALRKIALSPTVRKIAPVKNTAMPAPVRPAVPPIVGISRAPVAKDKSEFDHHGLTGNGVLVGIVDTGIDWRHPDFIDAAGKTRIVALWDQTDDTWDKSGGKIGAKPPIDVEGKPLGTIYTADDIDAALAGKLKIASVDKIGHGTACAGTATGNGGFVDGKPTPNGITGVAPEAFLIVVNSGDDSSRRNCLAGTLWVAGAAQAAGLPCVISESYGSQDSPHDGTDAGEEVTNELLTKVGPGLAVVVAAGNDGQFNLHSHGRFGPKREGQADASSESVDLYVDKASELDAYFDTADDWGLQIYGMTGSLASADDKTVSVCIGSIDGVVKSLVAGSPKDAAVTQAVADNAAFEQTENKKQVHVVVPLQPGHYWVCGFSTDEHVSNGAFDLYLPFPNTASFGAGTVKKAMVASPGNAASVITVGAYNSRASWPNADGTTTRYNLALGDISEYSSPGYRRDGVVKPEIVAPATYHISTLAKDSEMGKTADGTPDKADITPDGAHIAWSGTSVSAPYTAGVIALMLQKNPKLTQAQIKAILTKTATHDKFTGAVPNPEWGYGKIDPEAAILQTPAAK